MPYRFDADEITSELAAIEVDADPGHEPTPPEGIKSEKCVAHPDNAVSCAPQLALLLRLHLDPTDPDVYVNNWCMDSIKGYSSFLY